MEELNEFFQITQLVVGGKKHLKELVPLDAVDVRELVVGGIHFLHSEVGVDVIQIA